MDDSHLWLQTNIRKNGNAKWLVSGRECSVDSTYYLLHSISWALFKAEAKVGGYSSNLHPLHPMEGCGESGGHPGNNLAKFRLHPRYESRKNNKIRILLCIWLPPRTYHIKLDIWIYILFEF